MKNKQKAWRTLAAKSPLARAGSGRLMKSRHAGPILARLVALAQRTNLDGVFKR